MTSYCYEVKIDLAKVKRSVLASVLTERGYCVTPSIEEDGLFFTRGSKEDCSAVTGRVSGARFRLLCNGIAGAWEESSIKRDVCFEAIRRTCAGCGWSVDRMGPASREIYSLRKGAAEVTAEILAEGALAFVFPTLDPYHNPSKQTTVNRDSGELLHALIHQAAFTLGTALIEIPQAD